MKFVFRVDASIEIGSGHVMRCLTLANALKNQGHQCFFICRKHCGHLISYLESFSYEVYALKQSFSDKKIDNGIAHADWLGVSEEEDAKESIEIIKKIDPDWIVVDHYAITKVWENLLKKYTPKIMIIDDLADREHSADLLLDQNLGRKQEDYQNLVPSHCQLLIGPEYALLRLEFSAWREYSLNRRKHPQFKKILINLGGVDKDNITSKILTCFSKIKLASDTEITVIMGVTAPWLNEVKSIATQLPYKTEVRSNVNNMAEIMANSDLALGAAGSTTWERCVLGLPTINIAIADNQLVIVEKLREKGLIIFENTHFSNEDLHNAWRDLSANYLSMVDRTFLLCDGHGLTRVVTLIVKI